MAEIKLLDIVKILVESGHQIEYTKRTDGSIRITSIDGQKYKASEGNTRARQMTGNVISARRSVQLARIQKVTRRRKTPLPSEVKKELARVQRKWRRKKVRGEGTVTTKNVRYVMEHFGEQEAMRRLLEAERYSEGLAYTENVKALINYINDQVLPKVPKKDEKYITEAMSLIARNISTFKEEWIMPCYNLFYDYNKHEKSVVTVLSSIQALLK